MPVDFLLSERELMVMYAEDTTTHKESVSIENWRQPANKVFLQFLFLW